MSLLFGEIVEPSTRAFWDNYDDFVLDQESTIRLNLCWAKDCNENSIPKKINTFLIIEGIGNTSLINALVGKSKQLCRISDSNIVLYQINDELIVCASDERDLNKAGEATELILPFVRNAETVIGISIQTSVTFKGKSDDNGECFVRGIQSSIGGIEPLDVPNFVTGLAAGCATYRLHSNLEMSLYACFVATPFYDLVQIEPILELLGKLGIPINTNSFNQNREKFGMYM